MDTKTKLIQDVMEILSTRFDSEDLEIISNAMIKSLSEYDVAIKSTALTVYNDKNDRLLKRYAACLSVDGKSKKTIDIYIRRLKSFSDFIGIPFVEIGTYDVRFYLATMKENGCSNRTLENYRSYIASFFQWLAREDFITRNPCDKIPPIRFKDEVKHSFSDIEIDAIRSACHTERERALIELLLTSGIRVAELANLDITDIDFNNLSVHIREGKGSKERMTYMTDVCALHLKKYLFTRLDGVSSLLISTKRKERMTTSGIRKILKRIEKESNVANVHPHRFRRTFATNLAKRGMDIQTIAKLMGHADLKTTMIYVSMDNSKVLMEYKKHTA